MSGSNGGVATRPSFYVETRCDLPSLSPVHPPLHSGNGVQSFFPFFIDFSQGRRGGSKVPCVGHRSLVIPHSDRDCAVLLFYASSATTTCLHFQRHCDRCGVDSRSHHLPPVGESRGNINALHCTKETNTMHWTCTIDRSDAKQARHFHHQQHTRSITLRARPAVRRERADIQSGRRLSPISSLPDSMCCVVRPHSMPEGRASRQRFLLHSLAPRRAACTRSAFPCRVRVASAQWQGGVVSAARRRYVSKVFHS